MNSFLCFLGRITLLNLANYATLSKIVFSSDAKNSAPKIEAYADEIVDKMNQYNGNGKIITKLIGSQNPISEHKIKTNEVLKDENQVHFEERNENFIHLKGSENA